MNIKVYIRRPVDSIRPHLLLGPKDAIVANSSMQISLCYRSRSLITSLYVHICSPLDSIRS